MLRSLGRRRISRNLPKIAFGDLMTVVEHLMQSELYGPCKQSIGPSAAGQLTLDSIGQTCCMAQRLKFMAMGPFGEWPAYLTILKEAILFVRCVQGVPMEWTDAKFDAGARLQASGFSNHADGWERGTQ